jgi:hypothetical protein
VPRFSLGSFALFRLVCQAENQIGTSTESRGKSREVVGSKRS